MIPILYEANETTFTSNGLGRLSDASRCVVIEERNGSYELEMEYLEGGAHFSEITVSRIIWAKPAQLIQPQPFRIYKITKPLNGRVTVYAQHISYQLSLIPVTPFTASNASDALNGLKSHSVTTNPFTVQSTVSAAGSFAPEAPASFRNMLGGMEGSVLDVFGGELEFDRYAIKLHASRGTNRGLTLRYGKNIVDINQEESIEETITGIMPYYKDQNGVTLYLTPKVVESATASNYPFPRDIPMDMGSYIDEKAIRDAHPSATEEQIEGYIRAAMLAAAQAYITAAGIGVPEVSIDVNFVNLGDTEEYKDLGGIFAQAALCDTVTVIFERLGISTTAKIVKTEWNVLLDKFNKITIGSVRATLGGIIASVQMESEEAVEKVEGNVMQRVTADIEEAVKSATESITGGAGGHVKINYDANGKPYEILILDTEDQLTAVKVWRWNIGGLGYSGNGYGGDYQLALTPDGKINASRILSGELEGQYIKGGAITTDKLDSHAVTADKIDTNVLNVNGVPLSGIDITSSVWAGTLMSDLTYKVIRFPYMVSVTLNGTVTGSSGTPIMGDILNGLPTSARTVTPLKVPVNAILDSSLVPSDAAVREAEINDYNQLYYTGLEGEEIFASFTYPI